MSKTATNPITGDKIQTKSNSQKYYDNYDAIFRKNKELKNDESTTNNNTDPSSNQ